jgi:hypothetical protein
MGSKTARTSNAQLAIEGGVVTDNVLARQVAKGVASAAPHTVPWVLAAGMIPVGAATHAWWGAPVALPWASAGLALSGAAVSGVAWAVSRYRKHVLGRVQTTATAVVASGWLLAATITGPTSRPTLDIGMWLGGTLAACWNVRNVVRLAADPDETTLTPAAGPGALFKQLIKGTAEASGVEIETIRNVKVAPGKVSGTVEGVTADDLQGAAPAMEKQGRMPMGSITVTPNRHDAGAPTVTVSNPLALENSVPHPGPSAVGASVARPLRVAMFQNMEPCGLEIVGSHLQIMGMTGAAKTTAGAWGIWGEFVTRKDGALIVVDITKKEQTVRPARTALHGAVTEVSTARKFFKEWLPAWAEERLALMGERGMIAWEERSGLSYLLVSIEEAADVFEHIDMVEFVNLARMLRSAGGGFLWSLQRADSSQMPTIVKGQGGGKVCFGVESAHDAGWGLTDEQEKAGAKPQQWRATQPGMAYADANGVPRERIAMPMRWYDWGATNAERVANFRAHCERYPASARPVDPITAKLLAKMAPTPSAGGGAADVAPSADTEETNVNSEYLPPNPELDEHDASNPVNPDADLPDVAEIPLGKPAASKPTPEQARDALDRELGKHAGGEWFAPKDLGAVLTATGLGRGWLQKQLKARVASGVLEHDDDAGRYRVRVLQHA